MREFDMYELKTPEAVDEAFAHVFSFWLPTGCDWAQLGLGLHAIRDFLESDLSGEQRVLSWELKWRSWGGDTHRFQGIVSNARHYGGRKLGVVGYGFAESETVALMKAAIAWDQRRRAQKREKVAAKRAAAREAVRA